MPGTGTQNYKTCIFSLIDDFANNDTQLGLGLGCLLAFGILPHDYVNTCFGIVCSEVLRAFSSLQAVLEALVHSGWKHALCGLGIAGLGCLLACFVLHHDYVNARFWICRVVLGVFFYSGRIAGPWWPLVHSG